MEMIAFIVALALATIITVGAVIAVALFMVAKRAMARLWHEAATNGDEL